MLIVVCAYACFRIGLLRVVALGRSLVKHSRVSEFHTDRRLSCRVDWFFLIDGRLLQVLLMVPPSSGVSRIPVYPTGISVDVLKNVSEFRRGAQTYVTLRSLGLDPQYVGRPSAV